MIIYIDSPELIQHIVFNLSSLYSGFIDLTDLCTQIAPINNTGMIIPEFVQSINFDIQYASAVINDPNLFCKLLMILSATYEGSIAIVMVQRDPYRDAIMESIIKFTQQRYGIISWIVEDPEDLFCIHETPFTPNGLITLIEDLKKFDELNGYANSISIE